MAQQQRDYYEILEISRSATTDEIKRAYRLKVRDCHPDTHPNDPDAERKYKEVNEAFSVLGNQEKRQRYDQFGTADDLGGNPFAGGAEDIFSDLFGSMFGGGFAGTRTRPDAPSRGSDLQMMLSITLEEAASGVTKKITIPRWEPCDHCHGTGQVRTRVRTIFCYTYIVSTCPTCGGRGKVVEKPCFECGGEGRIHRRREQEIKIQPGVDSGTRLRVPGAGEMGTNGGAPGDLYIVMDVKEHAIFRRDGLDLHRTVTIPFPLAVMGGKWSIGTLIDGDTEFEIPEGTAPGGTIRVRGEGMPRLRGTGRGDLYLHVTVAVPKGSSLSERGADLMKQLAEEMQVNVASEKGSGIFDSLFGSKKKTKKKNSKKK